MVIGRLAHVALGAGDELDASLRFYEELFGVVEVERSDSTIFLSGGKTPGFDLALGPWPPGLHHFAFEVGSDADLDQARNRLRESGVDVEEVDAANEFGVQRRLEFVLPSGHLMELILGSAPQVFAGTPTVEARHFKGAGPVELEHITINCEDVEKTSVFLRDRLDFRITEFSRRPGSPWFLAFLRCRDLHHDLGVFRNTPEEEGPKHNHHCFVVPTVNELVRTADLARGLGVTLQCSIGRHLVGDNVFLYLVDPSGNRVEVATPVTKIDVAAPTRTFESHDDSEWLGNFDAWRRAIPPAARAAGPCWDARGSIRVK